MKSIPSYRQPGEVVPVIAPYNVAAGDVVVVGGIVGLAATPAAAGASVEVCTTGVFLMKAQSSEVLAAGASVYWDAANGVVTGSPVGAKLGNVIAAKGAGDAETLVRVVSDGGEIALGVVTQEVRTSNFTLVASDSGSIIPVTGAVTVTLNASSDLTAPVEIRRYDAATLSITRTGVTAIDPSTGSAWGTLQVAQKLSSIIIYPGSVADEYGAVKVGA